MTGYVRGSELPQSPHPEPSGQPPRLTEPNSLDGPTRPDQGGRPDQSRHDPTRPETGRPASAKSSSPLGWMRGKRDERASRKLEAHKARVVQRVELLGPHWRVLDLDPSDPDFIAIGPGGIFSVTVCNHGRSRVELAGEVVQIEGKRPPYVADARKEAKRISATLSQAAGRRIPVIPLLAFMGSGQIVYYGKPPEGCVVASFRDIGRALDAHGNRLAQNTLEKLWALADRADTWANHANLGGASYTWYPDGTTAADKKPPQR